MANFNQYTFGEEENFNLEALKEKWDGFIKEIQATLGHLAIDNDGNLGIGGTKPLEKLHLKGNFLFDNHALIASAAPGNPNNVDHIWHGDAKAGEAPGTWHFVSDKKLKDNGNSRLQAGHVYMNGSNQRNFFSGKVGIGTEAPNHILHIGGDNSSEGKGLKIEAKRPIIRLYETDGNKNENFQIHLSNGKLQVQQNNDGFNKAATKLTILQNGNIGIGTDEPKENLEVGGYIVYGGKSLKRGKGGDTEAKNILNKTGSGKMLLAFQDDEKIGSLILRGGQRQDIYNKKPVLYWKVAKQWAGPTITTKPPDYYKIDLKSLGSKI